MLKNGFDSTYNILVEENCQLRGCLLTLQTELKDMVDYKMKIIKDIKSKSKEELLKEVNMKLYRLKIIEPKAFKLSLNENINDIIAIFKENIDRVIKFIDSFINPGQFFEFIDKINESSILRQKKFKIRNLNDLYDFIISVVKSPSPIYKMEKGESETNPERITAKWNTDFTTDTGEEEGIYTHNKIK